MFRRRLSLAVSAVACLLIASAAAADPINTFTAAAAAPSLVKPATSSSYTITLTNDSTSADRAQRARIAIPSGFTIDPLSVQATTTAVPGSCDASGWEADGLLIADGKIQLRRPAGDSTSLCPGAGLTVVFLAVSAATDGTYLWATELLHDTALFSLSGSNPAVVVDGTPPDVTITQKPSNPSNASSPSFAFASGDATSKFACKLDNGVSADCSSPKSYSGLAEGAHTFTVQATDAAGNAGPEATYTWTIDTTAPTTTITQKPPDPTNDSSPTFSFSSGEPGTSFACHLDAAAFAPCTSPKTYSDLADGSHTFAVRATDAAGNDGAETSYSWTIDTAAPTVTITGKPDASSNDTSPSFSFTASQAGSTFACHLNGAAFAPCTSPKSYAGLAQGTHTFTVKATDAAGNTGPETTYDWTIDTAAPTTTITGKPADPSNDTSPSFAFGANEPAGLECRLDAAPFAPCTSPKTFTGVAAGAHTFSVKASDAAGNAGAASTYSWTIDVVAPSTTISVKPSDPTNNTSPSFSFTASESGSHFSCKIDAEAFAPCASPKSYTALAEGSHTFAVNATDQAGNTGADESYTWTIDTTPPTTTITGKPADPSNNASPSFTFIASQAGSTFACKLDAAAFAPCVSAKSYAGLPEGTHTFAVRASDTAGNVGLETAYTWTIDTVAPTASITGKPSDPNNSAAPSFTFTASQAGSSFACKLDAAPLSVCTSPKSFAGLADGSHTFAVEATDPAGNTSTQTSYTWTIDTVAPTASITGKPSDPNNSTAPSFTFTASQAGSTFACKLDAAAFAACTSPKSYAGLTEGTHTFVVKATDPAGNVSAETSYTWTIDTAAPTATITQKPIDPSNSAAPSFTFTASQAGSTFSCKLDAAAFAPVPRRRATRGSPMARTHSPSRPSTRQETPARRRATAGRSTPSHRPPRSPASRTTRATAPAPSFTFTASQAGSTFACKLDAAAFAACTSPKSYAGLAQGTHTFTVKATDAAGNAGPETSYAWTIDTTAPTTTITAKPNNPTNTSSASFVFSASETSSFSCSLDGGTFAACTSPKSYSGLVDGSHTFAVRATDQAANLGPTVTHTWTIDTTAPTATITDKPAGSSNDTSPSFSFSAEAGSSFTCKLDAQAFAPCASPKSYSALTGGPHTFVVRASDGLGNVGPESSYTWTIDTTPPTATITQKPQQSSNVASPSFSFTSSESGSSFACRIEQGGFAPCTSPKTYGVLVDGEHTFSVRASDAAGNTGSAVVYTWTIDTVAPTTAITAKPTSPSNNRAPSFSFTASDLGSTIECKLDGAAFAACTSPTAYSGVADGPHTFTAKATDPAGNTGPATAYSWTIETRAPTVGLTSTPGGLSNSSVATFSFSADEPSSFDCNLDGRGFVACSSPASYYGLGDGPHSFSVRAQDAVGNFSSALTRTWTIDTIAPETTLGSKPKLTTSAAAAGFSFTATEGGTFECRLDGSPFKLCASPKSYGGLGKGAHRFEVRAIDLAGNADPTPALYGWKSRGRDPGDVCVGAPRTA